MRVLALCLLGILLFATTAQGRWAPPDDVIPTARLIENLEKQLTVTPDEPHLLARLGRIYSLRYALGEQEVGVKGSADSSDLELYEHGNGYPNVRHNLEGDAILTRIGDLHRALDFYGKAAKIAPKEAYIWLGLGYVRDEMAHAAAFLSAPDDEDRELDAIRSQVRQAWENKALDAYQRAMGNEPEIKNSFLTPPVELEASRYIRAILEPRKTMSREQKSLLKSAQDLSAQTARLPRMVTPIIFGLDGNTTLKSLLAPESTVSFDLDGTASGASWSWVQPDTAMLVWDGDGQGNVTSGRDLIGSVTWWLFWEHGYAVLGALDDDGDGWLRGAELAHLAAWQDRNSNGIADAGEVRPLAALGVRGLATTVSGWVDGMPTNGGGVEFTDGRTVASYDWIVSSVE